MIYTLNDKKISIPDDEISNSMKLLDISKEDAIQMWLDDHDYTENEEQNALDQKAKKIGTKLGLHEIEPSKKDRKPRTSKVSDEKKALFDSILQNIDRCEGVERENVRVLTENKLISVKIGDKTFKIDIIQSRK